MDEPIIAPVPTVAPLSLGTQRANLAKSTALSNTLGLGLLSAALAGGYRFASGLADDAKAAPTPDEEQSLLPIPVSDLRARIKEKTKLRKAADETSHPSFSVLNPAGEALGLYNASDSQPQSYLRGDNATNSLGVPWAPPAMALAALGGGVGGYKLVDLLMNNKRKKDLAFEVDEAKQKFLDEISAGVKTASNQMSPLRQLAVLRCQQMAKAAGDEQVAPPVDAAMLPKPNSELDPASYPVASNLGGFGTGMGVLGLLALLGGSGAAGFAAATKNDPARIAKEKAKRRAALTWASSPPEVIAV